MAGVCLDYLTLSVLYWLISDHLTQVNSVYFEIVRAQLAMPSERMAGSDNVKKVKESMLPTMRREQCKGQMSPSRACHVGVSGCAVNVDSLRLMFLIVSCLTQPDRGPPQRMCDRLGLVPALGLDPDIGDT